MRFRLFRKSGSGDSIVTNSGDSQWHKRRFFRRLFTWELSKQRNEKERLMEKHKTMQAVTIDKYGGKEVLKINKIPAPEPGPGEVLIKVQAAGVGVWDEKLREGAMKEMFPLKFPVVLGAD